MDFGQDSKTPGKRRYLFALTLLPLIAIIWVILGPGEGDDFRLAKREVLLRSIGHELLLQSGDTSSRVLPVQKVAEHEYQITFEKAFTFQPDSLVNTAQRVLGRDPHSDEYIVNVLNPHNAGVAYGFAIAKNKKDDIVACKGRKQPTARYTINIKFKPAGTFATKREYFLGGLSMLAFVGLVFLKSARPPRSTPYTQHTRIHRLGAILFDPESQTITLDGTTTDLTGTETRLLSIFAESPNEAIPRSRLQKEIWEDQGVIVGRSLDMFISKLRKKLEPEPDVNIVVIRGKGYKLEVRSAFM
ncbi:winged helix-turn-helix domain-containing protein [Pedobacter deserti]|uniref:winged helix-turn-helix domain-containing protein n=1 Tax=Pedobacter deserti TaxID=2817382 RepID=UPI002108FDCD|nr:helix-turn-helix domain-containing protein [Pedobacter sp. SYSU D00382]